MTHEEILDQVKSIVASRFGVDAQEVQESSSFMEDLGADSLDVVEVVMAFEDAFQVKIPDEDAGNIKTVGEAVAYIEEKKK